MAKWKDKHTHTHINIIEKTKEDDRKERKIVFFVHKTKQTRDNDLKRSYIYINMIFRCLSF